MKAINLIKAATAGTTWMTLYMNASTHIFKKQMKVIRVLGSLLTNKTKEGGKIDDTLKVKSIGTLAHYSVGLLFTYSYHLLWKNTSIKPTLKTGAALGLFSGFIGITTWETFIALHPNSPKISRKYYFLNLIIAHVIFGIATTHYYKKIQSR